MERFPKLPPEPAHDTGNRNRRRNIGLALAAGAAALLLGGTLLLDAHNKPEPAEPEQLSHADITTTMFWVGEAASEDNANISNTPSTWVENWQDEFGGVDDPDNRCGDRPCNFVPKENTFYAALPYNDLDTNCRFKPSQKQIPWYTGPPAPGHSLIKNSWIKIQFDDNGRIKTVYAQLEDAGPNGEDDTGYVLGTAQPRYQKSGLDLSPAAAGYLGLDGMGKTSWQFVNEKDIPDGPWKRTVTTSLPDCAQ